MQSLFTRFGRRYRSFFSIEEISETPVLQWMLGVSLVFFYLTFDKWLFATQTTIEVAQKGTAECWPYFQACTKLYFLHSLPYGYSQAIFYAGLFALISAAAYSISQKWWGRAHALVAVLFLWKMFVMFVLSYQSGGNYDYYHVWLTFILLFLPRKEYFLKVAFVLFYFLSVTTKFHETWILGTYFTTLATGLPIFPTFLSPLISNSVIFMQVVGGWFLLSTHPLRQRLALVYFAVFHLYSGILVSYHYPSIALTSLLVLFGPLYRYTPPPTKLKLALPGFIFLFALCLFQLPGHLIEGDQKLTLEGNRYGMFMFEANHQCTADVTVYTPHTGAPVEESFTSAFKGVPCNGRACLVATHVYPESGYKVEEDRWESTISWNRCDPYTFWVDMKRLCTSGGRVAMKFDHSIDGGPFYRIVDEPDICHLTYLPFAHNSWIKLPPEAQIVGYPVQNVVR